jgi:hypothetical protein
MDIIKDAEAVADDEKCRAVEQQFAEVIHRRNPGAEGLLSSIFRRAESILEPFQRRNTSAEADLIRTVIVS